MIHFYVRWSSAQKFFMRFYSTLEETFSGNMTNNIYCRIIIIDVNT